LRSIRRRKKGAQNAKMPELKPRDMLDIMYDKIAERQKAKKVLRTDFLANQVPKNDPKQQPNTPPFQQPLLQNAY